MKVLAVILISQAVVSTVYANTPSMPAGYLMMAYPSPQPRGRSQDFAESLIVAAEDKQAGNPSEVVQTVEVENPADHESESYPKTYKTLEEKKQEGYPKMYPTKEELKPASEFFKSYGHESASAKEDGKNAKYKDKFYHTVSASPVLPLPYYTGFPTTGNTFGYSFGFQPAAAPVITVKSSYGTPVREVVKKDYVPVPVPGFKQATETNPAEYNKPVEFQNEVKDYKPAVFKYEGIKPAYGYTSGPFFYSAAPAPAPASGFYSYRPQAPVAAHYPASDAYFYY